MEGSHQDLSVGHPPEKENLRKTGANCAGEPIPLHVSSMEEFPQQRLTVRGANKGYTLNTSV